MSPPVAPYLEAILRFARRKLSGNSALLLMTLMATFTIRFIVLGMIRNPDATVKWRFAKGLLEGIPISPDSLTHHSVRWGINLHIYLSQLLFGTHPVVYYIPVFLAALATSYFLFKIGLRIAGPGAAVAAPILFHLISYTRYTGSQLLPSPFSGAYICAVAYFWVRYANRPRYGALAACAAAMIGAYLTKVPNLFFAPGLALAVWWVSGKLSHAIALCAPILATVGVETLIYRLWAGKALGRITIISEHHLAHPKFDKPLQSFWELFGRYAELPSGMDLAFFGFLLCSLAYLSAYKSTRKDTLGLCAITASFFFFTTFAIKSVDPVRLLQSLNPRYIMAGMPLCTLIATIGVFQFLGITLRCARRLPSIQLRTAIALALVVGFIWMKRWPGWERHPIPLLAQYKALAEQALESGTPIVAELDGYAYDTYYSMLWSSHREPRARVFGVGSKKYIVNRRLVDVKDARQFARSLVGKEVVVAGTGKQGFYLKKQKLTRI